MTIAAILLAGGAGSRFKADDGTHKLLASYHGKPIVQWPLEAAVAAGFDVVYVVTGAVDLSAAIEPVERSRPGCVKVIHNERWAEGQATSLGVGLDAAEADGHHGVVIGLGDQPAVPASAWRSVGAAAGPIVAAVFGEDRRPPVKLDRSIWPEVPRTGDAGARILFRLRPELVSEIPCIGKAFDIDTMEDLERWS